MMYIRTTQSYLNQCTAAGIHFGDRLGKGSKKVLQSTPRVTPKNKVSEQTDRKTMQGT